VLDEGRDAALTNVRTHPGFTPRNLTSGLIPSTKGQIVRTRTGGLVRLTNRKAYARVIESGSRAHVIRPRHGKALRFFIGGAFVFRRRVNHPGTKPYRFLYRATLAGARTFEQHAAIKLGALARRFGK
jgi:hypothetical protein